MRQSGVSGCLTWSIAALALLARNDPPPAPSAREGGMEAGFSRTHCVIASKHNMRASANSMQSAAGGRARLWSANRQPPNVSERLAPLAIARKPD